MMFVSTHLLCRVSHFSHFFRYCKISFSHWQTHILYSCLSSKSQEISVQTPSRIFGLTSALFWLSVVGADGKQTPCVATKIWPCHAKMQRQQCLGNVRNEGILFQFRGTYIHFSCQVTSFRSVCVSCQVGLPSIVWGGLIIVVPADVLELRHYAKIERSSVVNGSRLETPN